MSKPIQQSLVRNFGEIYLVQKPTVESFECAEQKF